MPATLPKSHVPNGQAASPWSPTPQDMPPNEAPNMHDNTASLPATHVEEAARSPLSSADCRTLTKIIEDTQNTSPTPSPAKGEHDTSLLSVDATEDGSSDTGHEDEMRYTAQQCDFDDEAEEGYQDEDASMELSDAVDEDHVVGDEEDASVFVDDDDELEYVWSDGDTVEDIMNVPGKTAPPAPEQDLLQVGSRDQSASEETEEIKSQRAALERILEVERLHQERREVSVAMQREVDPGVTFDEGEDDAIDLFDDPEIRAIQAVQAETGMNVIEDDVDASIELEHFDPAERRTSRLFSPKPVARRASTEPNSPSPLMSSTDSRPAVMPTPSGRHLQFTPYATIPDTPFTKTLNYYKQYKGKENTPSKSRRNASWSEEIAELAPEANEEEEEEDLDVYREMDLAPMEPVMESDTAGDLITFGTPVKSNISTAAVVDKLIDESANQDTTMNEAHPEENPGHASVAEVVEDVESVQPVEEPNQNHSLGNVKTQQQPETTSTDSPTPAEEVEESNTEFSDAHSANDETQIILYPQHPTFVNVIALLPQAIIWTAVAPVAKYNNRAYEAVVAKLSKMKL